jgi:hypothetical protein
MITHQPPFADHNRSCPLGPAGPSHLAGVRYHRVVKCNAQHSTFKGMPEKPGIRRLFTSTLSVEC